MVVYRGGGFWALSGGDVSTVVLYLKFHALYTVLHDPSSVYNIESVLFTVSTNIYFKF